jgi:putative transcriptional regulator
MGSLKGRLLVATPIIGDSNFDRAVVLVLEHGDDGAVGLVLNRPTEVAVLGPLPEWDELSAEPPVVFVGGPVEQQAAIALARIRDDAPTEGWVPVLDRIGTLDLDRGPDGLAGAIEEVRVFAGYAGWGSGQLEDEIALEAWFVADATSDDVLGSDPAALWSSVLRRQGGDLALLSYRPVDPSTN